jgi:hypothetical protein
VVKAIPERKDKMLMGSQTPPLSTLRFAAEWDRYLGSSVASWPVCGWVFIELNPLVMMLKFRIADRWVLD